MILDIRSIVELGMGASAIILFLLYQHRGHLLNKAENNLKQNILSNKLQQSINDNEFSEGEYDNEQKTYDSLKRANRDLLHKLGLSESDKLNTTRDPKSN